jgi:RND family efflux transporter MFP subunit
LSTPEETPNLVASKEKNPLPLIAAAIVSVGLVAFLLGRGSAPSTPVPPATAEHAEEHGEEGHEKGDEEHGDEHGGAEEIKFEGNAAKTAGIVIAPVASQLQTSGIPFNGQLVANPNGLVRVSSLVPGRVSTLYVSPGDNVSKGQTLAIVESRAIGEAQSSYQQAVARFNNAKSNLNVVLKQARAGVFSRAPIEEARRGVVEATGDVRQQETSTRAARVALDTALRLARAGSFASPAVETARAQNAAANESLKTSQAALDNAEAEVTAAEKELERRKQLALAGAYVSRPVEEARRVLIAARSARSAVQSEVATTRANLNRAKTLSGEGLVSKRDLEAAQNAFETATANLEAAHSDEATAQSELERQQKLAATDVAGASEVQAAQSTLAGAQASVRARRAEVTRARDGLRLAGMQLARERNIFGQNIANRRETSGARSTLEAAQNALIKARQNLALANLTYTREQRVFKQNLNNIAQVQSARSGYVQAQSALRAARTALSLFKSSPGGGARIPIVAPISGVVQEREVAPGEVLPDDAHLMTLVNLDAVVVEAAIYERDISRVRVGSTVKVHIESLPGRQFFGRVNTIGTRLDPATRTLTARAFIHNSGALKIGMFARGQIVTQSSGSAITVPTEAVQKMEDKTVVFAAADEPNTFVAREVETGAAEGGKTIVKSGLKNGERVVVKGAFMVKAQALKAELGHHH